MRRFASGFVSGDLRRLQAGDLGEVDDAAGRGSALAASAQRNREPYADADESYDGNRNRDCARGQLAPAPRAGAA